MAIHEEWIDQYRTNDTPARFDYTCGHCGRTVSGRVTSEYRNKNSNKDLVKFLLCPSCSKGSVWMEPNNVIPGSKPGSSIQGLPANVNSAYEEARTCFSDNAHTACELICRKILMHVAVDKGAEEGKTFESYLDYLESKGFITEPIKKWADLIRKHGNKSTHELDAPDEKRSNSTLLFTMQLLRIIYEMEYLAGQFKSSSDGV